MRKSAILVMLIIGAVWITTSVYFLTRPKEKVDSFKEVNTQTLQEVQIRKISDYLPGSGLYQVKVNDSVTVLIYLESHGNSMIRIK
jgi:hypothetical protein